MSYGGILDRKMRKKGDDFEDYYECTHFCNSFVKCLFMSLSGENVVDELVTLSDLKREKSSLVTERGDQMRIAFLEIEIAKKEIERGEALKATSNLQSAINSIVKADKFAKGKENAR
jgi:hypothetical protein